ncbi:peptidoglycan-binding protein [Paucisalibacillus sp. EB02]|uniref:peptidoglycan-binding protein n=1 Tax=Paucisalibacillus sp. EB02 TaxID=1347087 RepID=UPI0004B5EE97|nr:peptidoglycan-binding protein [Paucisalibacillus sp. EB02]
MNLFINHSIEQKNNAVVVTLYIDNRFGFEEFSDEFQFKEKKRSLENEAKKYIETHLPNLKKGIVKIAFGTMSLTVLPVQTFAEENPTSPSTSSASAYTFQVEDNTNKAMDEATISKNKEDSSEFDPDTNEQNTDAGITAFEANVEPSTTNSQYNVTNSAADSSFTTSQPAVQDTTYIVVPGDTLTRISRLYDVSINQIKTANNLTSDTIYVGQVIVVPIKASSENGIPDTQDDTQDLEDQPTPESTTEPLQKGMYRDDAITIKNNLERLGFAQWKNPPNNYFGSSSELALMDFQAHYGLQVTGIADKITIDQMESIVSSPLQEGGRHDDAIQLKKNLEILGYVNWKSEPTNYFGSGTKIALQNFQRDNDFPTSGIADKITISKLNELASAPLQPGMNRADAINVKKNLDILGYIKWSNPPNSYYGAQTEAAVKSFQSDYNLPATGIVDAATKSKLEALANVPLQEGMHRTDAIELKLNLETLGFINWKNHPNDFFGRTSVEALRNFQTYYGLEANGTADQETINKMKEILSSPLQDGKSHVDAIQLKKDLAKIGIVNWKNPPTNFFGTSTKKAVQDFQKTHNLPISGIADSRTLQKVAEIAESVAEVNSFYITGKGYGHAVGMTQWGAYGMAQSGYSYDAILKYYYTGTEIGTRDTENQIVRVLLTQNASTLKISSNQPYQVGDKEFLANSETTIQYQDGEYIIKNSDNTYTRTTQFQISSSKDGLLYFDNMQYEGIFYVSSNSGTMDLVNHLSVENYLKGVVPYEIIPSWNNLDLFKTQTLAARTYVLKEIQRNYNGKFDVYDTVRSQVYNGIPKDIPEVYVTKINQAISDTKGKVILYNGGLIDAVYSASSGGHTVDAVEVWGNSVPYLVGKEDPYDTFKYSQNWWSYTISKQDLEKLYPNAGKIIDVKVEETKFNRPTVISIVGENGTITISGKEFRSKIGMANMLSNTFTIEGIQ